MPTQLHMPTGNEKLYLLKLDSDIQYETFGDLILKKVTDEDRLNWFGVKIVFADSGTVTAMQQMKVAEATLYGRSFRSYDTTDITGLKFYEKNYVLYGQVENVRPSIAKIDKAIRLYVTGGSGISSGLTNAAFEYFYPRPDWHELPKSKILQENLANLLDLVEKIDIATGEKSKLIVDRYRNATQGGSSGVESYNRFIDLITILEILFVPDGSQGEIGYKLRMRGSSIVSTALNKSNAEAKDILKRFYNKRSKIVHGGEHDAIQRQDWFDLCSICNKAIVKYLCEPNYFTAEAMDSVLLPN